MIENQVPQIRDLHENGPENTVHLVNSGVKSDHPDEQSPDGRRSIHPSLFPRNEGDDLRLRWRNIQVRFVDEPRQAVEEADQLVVSLSVVLPRSLQTNNPVWSSNGLRLKPLRPKTCARVCASIVRSLTGCSLCKGRDNLRGQVAPRAENVRVFVCSHRGALHWRPGVKIAAMLMGGDWEDAWQKTRPRSWKQGTASI